MALFTGDFEQRRFNSKTLVLIQFLDFSQITRSLRFGFQTYVWLPSEISKKKIITVSGA